MSYECAKAAAIARNILAPYAQELVVGDLNIHYYLSVSSDASNVGSMKTFPYAVQYLNPKIGICKTILDFYEDPFKKSKDIFGKIKQITEENNLNLA